MPTLARISSHSESSSLRNCSLLQPFLRLETDQTSPSPACQSDLLGSTTGLAADVLLTSISSSRSRFFEFSLLVDGSTLKDTRIRDTRERLGLLPLTPRSRVCVVLFTITFFAFGVRTSFSRRNVGARTPGPTHLFPSSQRLLQ
jgi:hypothetical protein